MKLILKKVFTPIVVAIIMGGVCGKIFYRIYSNELENKFKSDKIYLLQSGSYKTFDNMKENNYDYNYLYYIDNNLYKSIIGITKEYDNVEKIKSIYPKELVVNEYYVSDNEIIKEQEKYDKMLLEESDRDKEWDIINSVLNLYKKVRLFYTQ